MTGAFFQSLQRNKKGIFLMLISSMLVALGQMCWKLFQNFGINISGISVLSAGFILYFLGAVIMIVAFKFGELSVLHPFLSASYIFAIFIGFFILHERISLFKILSIALIGFGLILLGGGSKNEN